MTTEEINTTIAFLRKEAAVFAAQGKTPALFWAGRLSAAAELVSASHQSRLSDSIAWMDAVRQEYDDEIMRMTLKRTAQ